MSNLTFYDRQRIEYYLNFKQFSLRDIAKFIGRNVSIVSREIKRNKPQLIPYNAELAQKAAERKSKITNSKKLEKCEPLKKYIRGKINEDWSPEQIAGYLTKHSPPELKKAKVKTVCAETIYQHVYDQDDTEDRLYHHLRRCKPKRQKQGKRKYRTQTIPDRISIDQRPEIINNKERYGDLETDLILGRYSKEAIQTSYERKAMYTILQKLTSKKAEESKDALSETIENFPPNFIKSITYDNGSENVNHWQLKRDYKLKTYFCDTYAAWQKGGVENVNGLIRQYIPKKTDLRNIDQEYLNFVQKRLNSRPRKSLGYLTPHEVMSSILNVN